MGLREEFEEAVKAIQALPKDGPYQATNDEKLKFYGWFKQATEGKCTTEKPAFYNVIGRAKWNAWNDLGDMSAEECMRLYLDEYANVRKIADGLAPAS
ncbi:unnamed protein product [Allacma fusca]|uniref:ACB domain-containing protein n=1 Tax=Allacma fusca TaxID=39272 RepID=A0A8J2LKE0_9HEXA|nr:unnamed protein product [Allacma fusca]